MNLHTGIYMFYTIAHWYILSYNIRGVISIGTARTRANNKYAAKAYDRIALQVKKGKKEVIVEHAQAQGKSLNGFINEAIDNQIARDNEHEPGE